MSTVMEMIGLSPMGFNSVPAMNPMKTRFHCVRQSCDERAGKRSFASRYFDTRAFENAIASVAATGGSTNAVWHLLAIAREAGVALEIEDFQTVSVRTPVLADLKPSGRFVAFDMHRAGGIRLLARRLLNGKYLHAEAMTRDRPQHRG